MKKLLIINAIVWAALILVASFLFKDVPNYNYFFLLLVFGAGLTNSFIYTYSRKVQRSKC